MGLTEAGSNGKFINIAQGRFRIPCEETNPKAVKREWEKDGKKGVKHELVYSKLSGIITGIKFKDSDFGEQIAIEVSSGQEKYIINVASDSRYALDFMRRLPGVEFHKEVELTPYDMENEGGKKNTGIKVVQDGETIKNKYWDDDSKKNLHGMPEMTDKNPDSDDWKMYFIKVKKFLKKRVEEQIEKELNPIAKKEAEIEEDDLPF